MAYQGLPDGPFSERSKEKKRAETAGRLAALDGLSRYAQVERTQVPGMASPGVGSGIGMAGQAISGLIQTQARKNQQLEQTERALQDTPIIQGTGADWNKAFNLDQTLGYANDTNWAPSSWSGSAEPTSVTDFGEAFSQDNKFNFAEGIDWGRDSFNF